MWKTPEPFDDVVVPLCVIYRFTTERPGFRDTEPLIFEVFGVGEWQIHEYAHWFFDLQIETGVNGRARSLASQSICFVDSGRAAKAIAWKLVQQKHEGESRARRLQPILQFSRRSLCLKPGKPLVKLLVEGIVLCEPALTTGVTPEIDDFSAGV